MLKLKFLFLSIGLITIGSIAAFAQPNKLSTQQWKLVQVNGQRVVDSKAFLEINNNRNRFMGNTGCNQMSGGVTVRGRRIDFSNVATTRMFCGQPKVNQTERAYVRALENVDRYRQVRDTLELLDRNRVVLKFTAMHKEYPDNGGAQGTRLEDKKWMLESIAGRKTFKAIDKAFLVFDAEKKSAGGDSSCNVFGGSYSVKGDRLQITDVVSTMRACIEDDRMDTERHFLDGLRATNRYKIENNRLYLYRGEKLLLTLRGERK